LLQATGLSDFALALRQMRMANQLKSSAIHWAQA